MTLFNIKLLFLFAVVGAIYAEYLQISFPSKGIGCKGPRKIQVPLQKTKGSILLVYHETDQLCDEKPEAPEEPEHPEEELEKEENGEEDEDQDDDGDDVDQGDSDDEERGIDEDNGTGENSDVGAENIAEDEEEDEEEEGKEEVEEEEEEEDTESEASYDSWEGPRNSVTQGKPSSNHQNQKSGRYEKNQQIKMVPQKKWTHQKIETNEAEQRNRNKETNKRRTN